VVACCIVARHIELFDMNVVYQPAAAQDGLKPYHRMEAAESIRIDGDFGKPNLKLIADRHAFTYGKRKLHRWDAPPVE
jgi:hypothetical protein